jgi:hypothetical protein
MSDNHEEKDFEKLFTEIVQSDDLKEIKEDFEAQVKLGIKELILIQQSLSDVSNNISEIMIGALTRSDNIFGEDNIYHNLLSSLYKIAEDFNECMLEYYADDIFEDDEDELGDEYD